MQEHPALQAMATARQFFTERRYSSEFPVQTIRADGIESIERQHVHLHCKSLRGEVGASWADRR
jgi:hypothetical protein